MTWCARTSRLWWVDLFRATLRSYHATGHTTLSLPGKELGSFALCADGGLLLALDDTLQRFDPDSGALDFIGAPESGADRRFNDGRCDRQGRFWVGAMDRAATVANGVVYRVDPDRTCHAMFGDFTVPNSAAFSPDGTRYYFSDCRRKLLWEHTLDVESGAITGRRLFADTSSQAGQPDGACVDEHSCLWLTLYDGGRLLRFTPDGRLDRVVTVPVSKPTCCTFGGEALDVLFVNTAAWGLTNGQLAAEPLAGSLLALDVGVRGIPEPYFGE